MRSCLLIFIVLAVSQLDLSDAIPGCPRACTREFRPVCAIWRRPGDWPVACTFPNECELRNQVCSTNQQWQLQDRKACTLSSRECGELLKQRRRPY